MGILSIQSWVNYGYVGNKAAVYPLQCLGFDVWPINTVQFSNHTGYGFWQGQVFHPDHIQDLLMGIKKLGVIPQCQAILTGYLGDSTIGEIIRQTVLEFKEINPDLVYLCDPVMGDRGRGFFVKEGIPDFFKEVGIKIADIITPNHFEAEAIWGHEIATIADARQACHYFHGLGAKTVLITSFVIQDQDPDKLHVFLSTPGTCYIANTPYLPFDPAPNGTGDLFAALFLGFFLRLKCPYQALEKTLQIIYGVLRTTFQQKSREIAIFGPILDQEMKGVTITLLKEEPVALYS